MVAPMLPELTARPLRAISRASMRHTVALEEAVRIRQPNGEYETTWVSAAPVPCLLMSVGSATAAIGEARGVKAEWTLRLTLGLTVEPGARGLVRGITRGVAWQRLVTITSSPDLTARLFGLATAVDVDLSQ